MRGMTFGKALKFASAFLPALFIGAAQAGQDGLSEPKARAPEGTVVLTLDACSSRFDMEMAKGFANAGTRVTVFATGVFLRGNKAAAGYLASRPDIFQMAVHGDFHKAPVYSGAGPFGLAGVVDSKGLEREVLGAWRGLAGFENKVMAYRGAGARYSKAAQGDVEGLGFSVGAYGVAPDAGGSARPSAVRAALSAVRSGDVVLLHATRPGSGLAQAALDGLGEGLSKKGAPRAVWWSEAFGGRER